jgi:hypothetical protein
MPASPRIDQRDQQKVAEQVRDLLYKSYCAREWENLKSIQDDKNADALIQIFSRMMEIIIQRLNKVPDKNFLAFLDMVGTRLSPPRVARAPLTFTMAKGKTTNGKIPKGTQATTIQTKELPSLVFETDSDLTVIQPDIIRAVSISPDDEKWTDHTSALFNGSQEGAELLLGKELVPHRLYLGHDKLFSFDEQKTITLDTTIASQSGGFPQDWEVAWYYFDKNSSPMPLKVKTSLNSANEPDNRVANLLISGSITFELVAGISEKDITGFDKEKGQQNSWKNHWIFAELKTPVPEGILPDIESIEARINSASGLSTPPDFAFSNGIPLDLTKDIYPFGERPSFGDTFYISSKEVFSKEGATITIGVTLSPGADKPDKNYIKLSWEFWDGKKWGLLGETMQTGEITPEAGSIDYSFDDQTEAFTHNDGEQIISFKCPKIEIKEENGKDDFWIRIRIIGGNYGEEASYESVGVGYKGTGTISSSGTAVTGDATTTRFQKEIRIGDSITAGTQTRIVTYIASDASLTVNFPFENPLKSAEFTVKPGWIYKPPTFKPPCLSKLTLQYTFSEKTIPQLILAYNDFVYNLQKDLAESITPFKPFHPVEDKDKDPTFYLAFDQDIARLPVTLFFLLLDNMFAIVVPLSFETSGPKPPLATAIALRNVSDLRIGDFIEFRNPAGEIEKRIISNIENKTISWKEELAMDFSAEGSTISISFSDNPPVLAWEYWDGKNWSLLNVEDKTVNLTKRELIQFLAPGDIKKKFCFGEEYFWIRARLDKGRYEALPSLESIHTNTVWASNLITVKDETLGSSNGKTSQVFNLSHSPALPGQNIRVLEHSLTEEERKTIIEEEGTDKAVGDIPDEAGNITGYWVQWHEVSHFYSSGPHSRHYIIDRIKGTITFGDGKSGMIPPPGKNNIVCGQYQYGGGSKGNFAGENTIKKLRTAFPFIASVTNYEGADGGGDEETLESVKERGPQTFKHRERAVTYEDFEWLVRASPKVAKVKCLPTTDPGKKFNPGWITIIIVPDEPENEKPVPSRGLISEIERDIFSKSSSFLTDLSQISLIGPGYIQVRVEARVHFNNIADAKIIEGSIVNRLNDFFHPLKGRPDRSGWDFGKQVYISEVYEVIEDIDGVDYVEKLSLKASIQIYKLNLESKFIPEVSYEKNSKVEIRGGKIVCFLAEKAEEKKEITSLTVLGFKEGDKVTISSKSNGDYISTVVLKSVSGDVLECETNTPGITVHDGSVVETSDGIKSFTIGESTLKADTDNVILLTVAISKAGDDIVLIHPDIPGKPAGLIETVSDQVETVYVEDNYLVYSGVHSINK